jgi:hypothetical protein
MSLKLWFSIQIQMTCEYVGAALRVPHGMVEAAGVIAASGAAELDPVDARPEAAPPATRVRPATARKKVLLVV